MNYPVSKQSFERTLLHLRKSRADLEAEARGEGETLAKHRTFLLKFAQQNGINIVKIREELASGESLVHRPEMLETLKEVELGIYDAVLCMDVDRLGRGDMQEQGLILGTFKRSNTKIITPRKVYDLNDEFDEEYSEFEAFMARKELKIINRRLQSGRVRSITDGKNYIATAPPYGYLIEKSEDRRYLVPHPEQAPVVKMIFEWYTDDDPDKQMGANKIANELNMLGYRTYTGIDWQSPSVLAVIKNPAHVGRLVWKKKDIKKSTDPGKKRDTKTRPKEEWIDVQGTHEPLITPEVFARAQEILQGKYHVPYQLQNGITNPLAGLVRCSKCGSSMVFRPYYNRNPHLVCYRGSKCQNKSSRFDYVEHRIIDGLKHILAQYKADWSQENKQINNNAENNDFLKTSLKNLEKELTELQAQKNNLHDLLERGVYDIDTFLTRSQVIVERIEKTTETIGVLKNDIQEKQNKKREYKNYVPKLQNALDVYLTTDNAAHKNALLKTVLDHAIYTKEKHQRDDDFTLVLVPKIIK